MKKITAKFIGSGSLGYIPGTYYTIILKSNEMSIIREDGTGLCIYSSLYAFLDNWDDIKNIEI